jgi:hypothetical protein
VPSAGTGIGGGDIRPFYWSLTNFDNPDNPLAFFINTLGSYIMRINSINPKTGKTT